MMTTVKAKGKRTRVETKSKRIELIEMERKVKGKDSGSYVN